MAHDRDRVCARRFGTVLSAPCFGPPMRQEKLDGETARAELEAAERQMPAHVSLFSFPVGEVLFGQGQGGELGEIAGGVALELEYFALGVQLSVETVRQVVLLGE